VLPTQVEGQAEPSAEVIRVNVVNLQSGALDMNVELKPNDTVFVPQAPKVFVSGEVRNPGAYAWFPGITARQLISMAGGLNPEGSDGRLKVVRDKDGKPHEDGIKLDETVKAGETLVVRRRLF
jgi:polysaccharide export outer membrane protein